MGLRNPIQRIKKSWSKGYGEGNASFTAFKGLFVDTHSEFLIITLLITTIWILLTHVV